jgi:hypothetical protein
VSASERVLAEKQVDPNGAGPLEVLYFFGGSLSILISKQWQLAN